MRSFDSALIDLRSQLLTMAGLVERAIECATDALKNSDLTRINEVFETEERINQSHIAVDEACVKLLALQQPLANDLRLIVAILKINTDLERMGDQAVNIADNSRRYLGAAPLKPLIDLPVMSEEVRFMVREAIDAFVKGDESLARDVLARDDRVDALKGKIFRDVLEHLKTNAAMVEQGLNLILIARNLERVGDHATNIAEDVIFAITGDDIRHSANKRDTIRKTLV